MNESEVVNGAVVAWPVVRRREVVARCLRGIQTGRRDDLGAITFVVWWDD